MLFYVMANTLSALFELGTVDKKKKQTESDHLPQALQT